MRKPFIALYVGMIAAGTLVGIKAAYQPDLALTTAHGAIGTAVISTAAPTTPPTPESTPTPTPTPESTPVYAPAPVVLAPKPVYVAPAPASTPRVQPPPTPCYLTFVVTAPFDTKYHHYTTGETFTTLECTPIMVYGVLSWTTISDYIATTAPIRRA